MSEIDYNINNLFPIAGEDNDTAEFRTIFTTIKNSLQVAKQEVTDLQDYSAKLIDENDFTGNTIKNASTKNIREHFWPIVISDDTDEVVVDYLEGSYQIIRFKGDQLLKFANFPDDTEHQKLLVGKVRLEVYAEDDSTNLTITIPIAEGSDTLTIVKNQSPFWNDDNDASVSFTVRSGIEPIIIDVWRHNDILFLHSHDVDDRVTALEADILTNDNLEIVNTRLLELETIDSENRLLELENVDASARLIALEDINADSRLEALEVNSELTVQQFLPDTVETDVNYNNGSYQQLTLNNDATINITNFYNSDGRNRKITLEIINSGSDDAVLYIKRTLDISTIKSNASWTLDSNSNPFYTIEGNKTVVVEAWTYNNNLFLNTIGVFENVVEEIGV